MEYTPYLYEPIRDIKRAQVCVRKIETINDRNFELKIMLEFRSESNRWAVTTAFAEPLPTRLNKRFKTSFGRLRERTERFIKEGWHLLIKGEIKP